MPAASTRPPSPSGRQGVRQPDQRFAELPSPPEGEGGSAPAGAETVEGEAKGIRLKSLAKAMRRKPTNADAALWRLLRDRRFVGYKFRRQVPIGPYIADFACYRALLVVELDGSQHAQSRGDPQRDAELRRRGFNVLRIWNNELTANRTGVLEAIWVALSRDTADPASVSAQKGPNHLLPQGEKEEDFQLGAQP